MRNFVDSFVKYYVDLRDRGKRVFLVGGIIFILGLIYFIPSTFAALTPLKSVEIKSEKLSYDDNTPGSWKVTKSAKWTGRGEAEITFDVDTKILANNNSLDVLFVIDVSSSMFGDRLERVKADTTDLLDYLFANNQNRAALITFGSSSSIISDFTDDKDKILNSINKLEAADITNYYQALVNVDNILKNYKREKDKECVVLFLTDGHPTKDTPNEVGQYNYLKKMYPYVTINGIQYEMGDVVLEPIKAVSDNQYIANMESLNNTLFVASDSSMVYDDFEINDFIDTNYFYVESEKGVTTNLGSISLNRLEQKVSWDLNKLKSGQQPTMTIKVRLKDELIGKGGVYPTNEKEIIDSTINGVSEKVESTKTPILADNYRVVYDGNAPDECTISNVPVARNISVYDIAEISDNIPKCDGYLFKGWKIITKDVEKLNDDYFIMPEKDVIIRAEWSKTNLEKSMDGTIEEGLTLYKQVQADVSDPTKYAKKYTGDTSTFKGGKDVYYYYGEAANNNVKFANYCWKIVRTTDTGGVKLLYAGKITNNSCPGDGILTNGDLGIGSTSNKNYGASVYGGASFQTAAGAGYMYNIGYPNSDASTSNTYSSTTPYKYGNSFIYQNGEYTLKDTVDVGFSNFETDVDNHHYTCFNTTGVCDEIRYVYGGFLTSTSNYKSFSARSIILKEGKNIEDAFYEMLYIEDVNKTDNTIKKYVDYWYEKNMVKYTNYLEDAVWCNDREIADFGPFDPNGGKIKSMILFKSYINSTDLTCRNMTDRFTVSKENGNGALTYPVALLTKQEFDLSFDKNISALANNFSKVWTMSPLFVKETPSYVNFAITKSAGGWSEGNEVNDVSYSGYLRPAISLRPGIEFTIGDGSATNPYVIALD